MTLQIFSIQLKKLYLVLALLSPIWIVIPILVQSNGGHQYLVIFIGLILLTFTGILAQKVARKVTVITVESDKISFEDNAIRRDNIENVKINKSGIGISTIEFMLKTEDVIKLNMPNLAANAEKGISFIVKNLPEVEIIEPEDLLDES